MSADLALEEIDVDLEDNRATASLTLDVDELFDDNGELRLWEVGGEWAGYRRVDGAYYYVHTESGTEIRCGERAVRLAVQERIEDPDIGGVGTFTKGAEP